MEALLKLIVILGIKHPIILLKPEEKQESTLRQLAKITFSLGQHFLATVDPMHNLFLGTGNSVLMTDYFNTTVQMANQDPAFPWVVMVKDPSIKVVTAMKDPVYFLHNTTLIERYKIKTTVVENVIGSFSNDFNHWQPSPDFIESLIERRSDFKNDSLFSIVIQNNFNSLTEEVDRVSLSIVPGGIEVTGKLEGLFHEVLATLSNHLNFTVHEFLQADEVYGFFDNDTQMWYGAMASLVYNDNVDLISADLTYSFSRSFVIDFLPPINYETPTLSIRRSSSNLNSWTSYLTLFDIPMWLTVGIFVLTSTAFIGVLHKNCKERCSYFMALWIAMSSLIGLGEVDANDSSSNWSAKVCLFSVFITGSLLFNAYNAVLLSTIVSQIDYIPFTDLESFSKTDFKLVTREMDTYHGFAFISSPQNSVMYRIYKNQMSSDSFMHWSDMTNMILTSNDKVAAYENYEHMNDFLLKSGNPCGVKFLWQSRQRLPVSFAFLKKSPYFPFFKKAFLQIQERGVLKHLHHKWLSKMQSCHSNELKPLGLNHIISLF